MIANAIFKISTGRRTWKTAGGHSANVGINVKVKKSPRGLKKFPSELCVVYKGVELRSLSMRSGTFHMNVRVVVRSGKGSDVARAHSRRLQDRFSSPGRANGL